MCIATVYLSGQNNNESVMQDVIKMKFTEEGVSFLDILGEEKNLDAKVKSVDFIKHNVVIELNK